MDEAGDIPEFVAKVAAGDDRVLAEGLVHAGRATPQNTETESVRTVFSYELHWVNDIAFTFAHFFAMGIKNETVEIDFLKWHLARNVKSHHNHASDPSEENIGASFHDVQWIVRVEITLGPISTDDRPVGATEPSVKSVLVADIFNAADFNFLEVGTAIKNPVWFVGRLVVGLFEHRDGDAPRDLAGDVPVFEVFEVVDEDFLFVLWVKFNFVVFKMFNSNAREFFDVDKPLFFKHWLNDRVTLIAVSDGVSDFMLADEKPLFFEIF